MKKWKKIITSVLTIALLVSLSAGSTFAAEKETYKYTVTFYAGNQGTFAGTAGLSVDNAAAVVTQSGDQIKVSGLEAGDVVSFNAQGAVAMKEAGKYYVQGVRLSGRDNDTVAASVFTVNEDADYVVAYGIRGNVTAYTVNYQDRNGNVLSESDIFYGNVGDKPVVAYKYIEGYAPEVLGFTKTLSENEAENVFTFVYEKLPEPTVEEIVVPGQPGTEGGTTGEGGEGTTGTDTGTDTPGTDAPEADTPGTDTPGTEGDEPQNDPIVDLDDEETPLGNVDIDDDQTGIPMIGMIAIVIIALVALANLIFFVRKRNA